VADPWFARYEKTAGATGFKATSGDGERVRMEPVPMWSFRPSTVLDTVAEATEVGGE